jgi:hypothetical protein
MNLTDERPVDELHGAEALAALEVALRNAMPDFHLRGRVKSLRVEKVERGVFIDVTFRKGSGMPDKVRVIVSRAQAESLRGQLCQVLNV